MLNIYDNLIDRVFLDEMSHRLADMYWDTANIANRTSWPLGKYGSHRLMGNTLYDTEAYAETGSYNPRNATFEQNIAKDLVTMYNTHLVKALKSEDYTLAQVHANLQFPGMQGSLHLDGAKGSRACVLMLSDAVIDPEDGGSFYHEPSSTEVPYRYGRLIAFEGSDPHKGSPFNKEYKLRFSIKFLLKPNKTKK